ADVTSTSPGFLSEALLLAPKRKKLRGSFQGSRHVGEPVQLFRTAPATLEALAGFAPCLRREKNFLIGLPSRTLSHLNANLPGFHQSGSQAGLPGQGRDLLQLPFPAHFLLCFCRT